MSLNDTVSAERLHIGFFGLRNAGKSSLVNAISNQELSLVSDIAGTTTDPVKKAMEILPLGPVVLVDTPGLDDTGELGAQRVRRAQQILAQADIAVLVATAGRSLTQEERSLRALLTDRKIPCLTVYNKADLLEDRPALQPGEMYVSARTGEGLQALKEALGHITKEAPPAKPIAADLLPPGGTAVLVTPIDESAPKGRMILPQQQTMRDLLDAHCKFLCCQPAELKSCLASLQSPPDIVITDSQAFQKVAMDTPQSVPLTSFSILFARYKGNLTDLVKGAAKLSCLQDGDKVLISEGCTHHRQCNDIGTVKLPGWIENYSGVKPVYEFTSGGTFPEDLTPYALVVHCGGCMLTPREMQRRTAQAAAAGVPMVNYGVAIAQMHGILRRSLHLFPDVEALLTNRPTASDR